MLRIVFIIIYVVASSVAMLLPSQEAVSRRPLLREGKRTLFLDAIHCT